MKKTVIHAIRAVATEMVVQLPPDSPLFAQIEGGASLSLNVDGAIFPHVVRHFEWHLRDQRVAMQTVPGDVDYHLIDIGANIGLFTRQMLANFPNVRSASCFEPSPDNLRHLTRNLEGFVEADVFGFGLHREEGELTFYKDTLNSGNYSFNASAVDGRPYSTISAPIRKISDTLFNRLLSEDQKRRRIIWKSDTQGLDEILAAEMSDDFWSRVDLMCFEGWRVEKPDFDRDRFRSILAGFDHAYLGRGGRVQETDPDAIVDYLNGTDRQWTDFFVARRPLPLAQAA